MSKVSCLLRIGNSGQPEAPRRPPLKPKRNKLDQATRIIIHKYCCIWPWYEMPDQGNLPIVPRGKDALYFVNSSIELIIYTLIKLIDFEESLQTCLPNRGNKPASADVIRCAASASVLTPPKRTVASVSLCMCCASRPATARTTLSVAIQGLLVCKTTVWDSTRL